MVTNYASMPPVYPAPEGSRLNGRLLCLYAIHAIYAIHATYAAGLPRP